MCVFEGDRNLDSPNVKYQKVLYLSDLVTFFISTNKA